MILHVIGSSSRGNGYVLEGKNEALILDAGYKYMDCLRTIRYDYSKVCGGLLTHVHKDHSGYIVEYLKAGIPFYTNDETVLEIETVAGEKLTGLAEKQKNMIGEFLTVPFYLPHTTKNRETGEIISCPNFGYLIGHREMGKLIFMTDFEYCRHVFKKQRVNHIMIECNHIDEAMRGDFAHREHVMRGHSSLSTVKKFLEVNKTSALRTVVLLHLSESNADAEIMVDEIQNVVGKDVVVKTAVPGLNLEINELPF